MTLRQLAVSRKACLLGCRLDGRAVNARPDEPSEIVAAVAFLASGKFNQAS